MGIAVKIRIIEWTVFLKEYVDKGNFDAVILGWNILQDPDLYNVWHSSQAVKGGLNFVNYKDPEVDKLLTDGRQTFDETKRKQCYDRFQEILADQQPYIFLYVPYSLPAVSSRIKGIVPAPAGITYNLEKWYVPKAHAEIHHLTVTGVSDAPLPDQAPCHSYPHLHRHNHRVLCSDPSGTRARPRTCRPR